MADAGRDSENRQRILVGAMETADDKGRFQPFEVGKSLKLPDDYTEVQLIALSQRGYIHYNPAAYGATLLKEGRQLAEKVVKRLQPIKESRKPIRGTSPPKKRPR
jgi:Mn-dependent DtxR family transcriptional regulator